MRGAILLVLLAGCVIEGPDGMDRGPAYTQAEKAWLAEALPVLQANCVVCHSASDVRGGIGFLDGETAWDIRSNLLASGEVNLDRPETSRLLSKGAHQGPAMTATEASKLLFWIQAERDERF
ncbi:MAG TPA: hypothetical protein VFV99_17880 [Kofleriaceae bacterium]|nr:hypothetical protein [Kofleriaceae bacterium]